MSEHRWGNHDEQGVRACVKEGCTVRTAASFRVWQRKRGGRWRSQFRELIPPCAGKEAGEERAAPAPLEDVAQRIRHRK